MFDRKYPYTTMSEYNLDWIIEEIRKMHKDWSDFKVLNEIQFAGYWDITEQYKPWTLVTDNNVGYISVQPVPIGIPINNLDYWKPVYDYDNIIPNIENRIAQLETRVSYLENRKVLIIGDSYNTGQGGGQNIQDMSGPISRCLGIPQSDVIVYATGGAGFKYVPEDNQPCFEQVLLDSISGIPASVKPSITDVFVIGGANDMGITPTDLVDHFTRFKTLVNNNYVNAKIQIFLVGWSTEGLYRTQMLQAYDRYDQLEVPVSRVFYILAKKAWMYNSTHPNGDGVEMLGKAIGTIASGGVYSYNAYEEPYFYFGDAGVQVQYATWYDTNNVYIKFNTFPGNSTTAYNIGYARVLCGQGYFPLNFGYYGEDAGTFEFPIHVLMQDTSNHFHSATLMMSLKKHVNPLTDTVMDVYLKSFEAESDALKTYNNINKIYFGGDTIVIPLNRA